MEEQLVLFETATLAFEKGFNYIKGNVHGLAYNKEGKLLKSGRELIQTLAPTQSLLQKWLREVHNIHIELKCFTDNTWDGVLIYENAPYEWDDNTAPVEAENYKTYEEALEICLQKALKLIKK